MIISNNQDVQIGSIRFFAKEFFIFQNWILLFIVLICFIILIATNSYKFIIQGICLSLISSGIFFFIVNEFPRIGKKKEAIIAFSRKINTNLNDIYSLKFFLYKEIKSILDHIPKSELNQHLKVINISNEYFSDFDKVKFQEFVTLIKPEYISLGHVVTKNPPVASQLKRIDFSSGRILNFKEVIRSIIMDYRENMSTLIKDDNLALQLHLITPELYDELLNMKKAIDKTFSYTEGNMAKSNYTDMNMKGLFFDVIESELVKIKNILSNKYFVQFPKPNRQAYEEKLR